MLKKNRLFTPGPTPLLPSAQVAMAPLLRIIGRRFPGCFSQVLADLKLLSDAEWRAGADLLVRS
jgi:hypothetical protein